MPKMPADKTRLIVGLGNPGNTYKKTRHNIGFMVLDRISQAYGIPVDKAKFDCRFGRGVIEDMEVILTKPQAFMNNSGPPVQKLVHFFKIPTQNVLVIHDDIDLVYGRMKIIERGSHGGHKGIRSLSEAFASDDFPRLRIGVGRPATDTNVIKHVLGQFSSDEEKILEKIITKAVENIVYLFKNGINEGMNRVNNRKLLIE